MYLCLKIKSYMYIDIEFPNKQVYQENKEHIVDYKS